MGSGDSTGNAGSLPSTKSFVLGPNFAVTQRSGKTTVQNYNASTHAAAVDALSKGQLQAREILSSLVVCLSFISAGCTIHNQRSCDGAANPLLLLPADSPNVALQTWQEAHRGFLAYRM